MTWISYSDFRLLVCACVFAALIGCESRPAEQAHPAEALKAVQPSSPAPSTSIAETNADAKKPFTTSGPLVADQQADIAAERDGRILRISVQIGDHVKAGQVLAVLDDRSLQSAVESEKAKVASLKAQVNEWEAEQKVEQADLRRADQMRAEKIRSEEDWEHVKFKLDETVAEVARYRADELAAEADLKSALIQLDQSRIVAPFAGVVGRSSMRLTQQVKKGDVLLWVTAVAPLRVLFTVPESAMAAFPAGAALELTTPVYPQLQQAAKVLRVSPVVDPASDSVQVIAAIAHPSPLLKPGMTMQVQAGSRFVHEAQRALP